MSEDNVSRYEAMTIGELLATYFHLQGFDIKSIFSKTLAKVKDGENTKDMWSFLIAKYGEYFTYIFFDPDNYLDTCVASIMPDEDDIENDTYIRQMSEENAAIIWNLVGINTISEFIEKHKNVTQIEMK